MDDQQGLSQPQPVTPSAMTSAEKFTEKGLHNRFRGRDGLSEQDRRWTAKVTDVRNWFVFAASERWREDNS
jgi:uncharacterized protein YPO0396